MTRTKGTAEWIIEKPWFKHWQLDYGDSTLVCHGGHGVGKTVLVSYIIDYLELQLTRSAPVTATAGLAYVHLDYKQRVEQSYEVILASLVKQLIKPSSVILEMLQTLYNSVKDPQDTQAGPEVVQQLLNEAVQDFDRIYLIIDAFDESDSVETHERLSELITYLQGRPCEIKVLITSRGRPSTIRPSVILRQSPPSREPVFQELSATPDDIRTYIESRIRSELSMSDSCSCIVGSHSNIRRHMRSPKNFDQD